MLKQSIAKIFFFIACIGCTIVSLADGDAQISIINDSDVPGGSGEVFFQFSCPNPPSAQDFFGMINPGTIVTQSACTLPNSPVCLAKGSSSCQMVDASNPTNVLVTFDIMTNSPYSIDDDGAIASSVKISNPVITSAGQKAGLKKVELINNGTSPIICVKGSSSSVPDCSDVKAT